MACFVDRAVGVERVFGRRENGIELRFLDIGSMAVDRLQRGIGIDGDAVRSKSEDRAVLLMTAVEIEMSVSIPGMVDGVPVRDFCEERPRILGEGVECETVQDKE